ncbi:MAG: cytochrome c [Phycisphaerales bacterium]|nr:cytochrome c [Phycisphaerales bacterium]
MRRYHEERFPFPSPLRLQRELRLPRPPAWMIAALLVLLIVAAIPPVILLVQRGRISPFPRIQPLQDMANQPRYGPQAASTAFADGRAMRLPPPGTVARGRLAIDDHYFRGFAIRAQPQSGTQELHFFDGLPAQIKPDLELLERGRIAFNIACVVCHGEDGTGRGPLHVWAVQNNQARWVPPTSLLSNEVRERPDGHLYNTIRQGIRNMPPHADQLDVHDRWATVAYIRHLQATVAPGPPTSPASGE